MQKYLVGWKGCLNLEIDFKVLFFGVREFIDKDISLHVVSDRFEMSISP